MSISEPMANRGSAASATTVGSDIGTSIGVFVTAATNKQVTFLVTNLGLSGWRWYCSVPRVGVAGSVER